MRDATAIVNLASTIRMLAAKRVADSAAWKHRGHRSAADWLAKETKCGVGDAIGALEAAEKISECPQVEAKARAGGLSGEQTKALAKAVAADPAAEDRLLGVAERDGLKKLKEQCREVELASRGDAQARYDKIHRERSMRHWTDDEGAFRLSAKLTPDAGATVLGALAPFEKPAFDRARKATAPRTARGVPGRRAGRPGRSQPGRPDDRRRRDRRRFSGRRRKAQDAQAELHGAGRHPGAAARRGRAGGDL